LQVCSPEIGLFQVRAIQFGVPKYRSLAICSKGVGPVQISSSEIGLSQVGIRNVNPLKLLAGEISPSQTLAVEEIGPLDLEQEVAVAVFDN
jgi:hypothetical protein